MSTNHFNVQADLFVNQPPTAPLSVPLVSGVVVVGGRSVKFAQWAGDPMASEVLALDTETAVIEGRGSIPPVAVIQVYDGEVCWLIHPDSLAAFIVANRGATFVCHNCAFDWHVVDQHLQGAPGSAAKDWAKVVDEDRLSDTMLLDQLVCIAEGKYVAPRNLADLAHELLEVEVNKDDPWRLKYGELIGQDWLKVDEAAWLYAATDAVVTRDIYIKLREQAVALSVAGSPYGPLTIRLQVKAAIALAAVTRRGMCINGERRAASHDALQARLEEIVVQLQGIPEFAEVFRCDRKGRLQMTKTGKPRMKQKELRGVLGGVASQHGLKPPVTSKGETGLAADFWREHEEKAPFISLWLQLQESAKLLQFFKNLEEDRIHPRYTTLVRTGRTSSSGPNIQQMPRSGDFREMFVPRPGHDFLIIDYSALELRTLAAVCLNRFKHSVLADAFGAGRDPHCFTAAMWTGIEYDEFLSLKQSDPDRFKLRRQTAKAINFGIPGGLGSVALMQYARLNYGVGLSFEEASRFRHDFLERIYPEIGQYMEDDSAEHLAENLGCSLSDVSRNFLNLHVVRRIVEGVPRVNGEAYNERFVNRTWGRLHELCRNDRRRSLIWNRATGPFLASRLFDGKVATTTGRVRGRANYPQRHNTPFQGLAADGAKLALWRLHREGFSVVAHIHDEFVIEVADSAPLNDVCERVNWICVDEMESVCEGVPVECEYSVASCWSKNAELIKDEKGQIQVWRPECSGEE